MDHGVDGGERPSPELETLLFPEGPPFRRGGMDARTSRGAPHPSSLFSDSIKGSRRSIFADPASFNVVKGRLAS